jgi:hypothetical protein
MILTLIQHVSIWNKWLNNGFEYKIYSSPITLTPMRLHFIYPTDEPDLKDNTFAVTILRGRVRVGVIFNLLSHPNPHAHPTTFKMAQLMKRFIAIQSIRIQNHSLFSLLCNLGRIFSEHSWHLSEIEDQRWNDKLWTSLVVYYILCYLSIKLDTIVRVL